MTGRPSPAIAARNKEIARRHRRGDPVRDIAKAMGVSEVLVSVVARAEGNAMRKRPPCRFTNEEIYKIWQGNQNYHETAKIVDRDWSVVRIRVMAFRASKQEPPSDEWLREQNKLSAEQARATDIGLDASPLTNVAKSGHQVGFEELLRYQEDG